MRAAVRHSSGLLSALAVVVPLLVFARTVAPTIYGVDSAELTTAAYLLGIAHPPGAPGYLLLAHLFTTIPLGDVGYRVNLFSAVAAAAAVGFLYAVARRCARNAVVALLACWLLAFSYYFWIAAVAAEIYALEAACFAAALWLALRWGEHRAAATPPLLGLLLGYSLGVHLSLLLVLPGFALLLAAPPRRLDRGAAVALLLGFAAGAGVYLYLPLRAAAALPLNPARDYWGVDLTTARGLWWMISGRAFARHFFAPGLAALPGEMATFASYLWNNFLALGAVLAVPGIRAGLRDDRWLHAALLSMFAGVVFFFLSYGVGDKFMMLLPAHLLWAIWVALGACEVGRWVARERAVNVAAPLLAGLVALALVRNYARVDVSHDWSARRRGEALVRTLPRDAVFVGTWPDLRVLEYLRVVDGERPDLELVDLYLRSAEHGVRRWRALAAGERPVAATLCPDLDFVTCEAIAGCGCVRVAAVSH
jgi:hypothetical protein